MRIARVLEHYDYNDISYGTRVASTQLTMLVIDIFGRKKIVTESFYGSGYFGGWVLCMYKKGCNSKVEYLDSQIKLSILTKRQVRMVHKLIPELDEDEQDE